MKRKYNVLIGDRTAEEIKIAIASAAPYEGEEPYSVMGRNLVDGFPKEVTLTPAEIREVLSEQIGVIIDAILTTLERTPPELSADILGTGITLAGGGAMLHGMDKLVAQADRDAGIHSGRAAGLRGPRHRRHSGIAGNLLPHPVLR